MAFVAIRAMKTLLKHVPAPSPSPNAMLYRAHIAGPKTREISADKVRGEEPSGRAGQRAPFPARALPSLARTPTYQLSVMAHKNGSIYQRPEARALSLMEDRI